MKFSYTQKIYFKSVFKLMLFPVIAIIIAIALMIYSINMIIAAGISFISVTVFFLGYLLRPTLDKFSDVFNEKADALTSGYEEPIKEERDRAKRGSDGENIIFKWVDELYGKDNSWYVLKNKEFISKDGSKFDVDLILIGPKGIFIFEIKNLSYDLIFTSEDCAVVMGDHIRKYLGEDPRKQVSRNAETIKYILKINGLDNFLIKRAVLFARQDSFRFLGKPIVYLIDNKDSLMKYISESSDDKNFTPEFCNDIKNIILNN